MRHAKYGDPITGYTIKPDDPAAIVRREHQAVHFAMNTMDSVLCHFGRMERSGHQALMTLVSPHFSQCKNPPEGENYLGVLLHGIRTYRNTVSRYIIRDHPTVRDGQLLFEKLIDAVEPLAKTLQQELGKVPAKEYANHIADVVRTDLAQNSSAFDRLVNDFNAYTNTHAVTVTRGRSGFTLQTFAGGGAETMVRGNLVEINDGLIAYQHVLHEIQTIASGGLGNSLSMFLQQRLDPLPVAGEPTVQRSAAGEPLRNIDVLLRGPKVLKKTREALEQDLPFVQTGESKQHQPGDIAAYDKNIMRKALSDITPFMEDVSTAASLYRAGELASDRHK
jgi:hypothetical protein